MAGRRIPGGSSLLKPLLLALPGLALAVCVGGGGSLAQQQPGPLPQSTKTPPSKKTDDANAANAHERSRKLILKDGTFQLVREYQRNGERVRYFSAERGDWEEIPAALIDWEATANDAAEADEASQATVEKIHRSEEAKKMDAPLDIDASLPVAQGVYLPSGEGLFVVEGKNVRLLEQAGSNSKVDRMRSIEQVLSPIPIVPGKVTVNIPGTRASLRLRTTTPEFYLREAPPDPDDPNAGPISRSSRAGDNGPDVILIRAKLVHKGRELESIGTLFGENISANRDEVALQRWEVAPHVYRFTLGETLTPGEYAMAEVLADGLNYFVWDFGVDGTGGDTAKKK